MTNIAIDPLSRGAKSGFGAVKERSFYVNLVEPYRRCLKFWTVLSELRRYSDDQLAELGICRSDIRSVVTDKAGS